MVDCAAILAISADVNTDRNGSGGEKGRFLRHNYFSPFIMFLCLFKNSFGHSLTSLMFLF